MEGNFDRGLRGLAGLRGFSNQTVLELVTGREGGDDLGELLHGTITDQVLGAAFEVHRTLGPGFLESVYEEALARELEQRQVPLGRQVEIPITYKTFHVGEHRLDMVVANKIIVELKTVKELADIHTAVLLSYLTATKLNVGLLLNFAKSSLEFKRVARTKRST